MLLLFVFCERADTKHAPKPSIIFTVKGLFYPPGIRIRKWERCNHRIILCSYLATLVSTRMLVWKTEIASILELGKNGLKTNRIKRVKGSQRRLNSPYLYLNIPEMSITCEGIIYGTSVYNKYLKICVNSAKYEIIVSLIKALCF